MRRILLATTALLALACAGTGVARAADPTLTGRVSSREEGAMEGVLVSARKNGSTISVTVVTDAEGRYRFPSGKLEAGHYTLAIRAAGYDLDAAAAIDIAAGESTSADLRLKKTSELAAQLTNADWMASVPDSPQRKLLASCTTCHTVRRILDSSYTADQFMALIPRMMRYGAMSMPTHPQLAADRHPTTEPHGDVLTKLSEYYASINRSTGARSYALRTAARPTGRATQVVITEYELPRPELTEPHDVIVDGDGTVWYSNFGGLSIGRLDSKSGRVTEYPLPEFKPGAPVGQLDLELDPQGNPWFAMMYQAAVGKIDKTTGRVETFRLPGEFDSPRVQIGMIDPRHSDVDGKIWFSEGGSRTFYRLDPVAGTFEHIEPFKDIPKGAPHGAYGIASDAANNLWFMDFSDRNVGRTDKSGVTLIYPVPTNASRPRRGHMTAEGRLAFAEFGADQVAVFDTRTEQIKEFPTLPHFAPYDAVLDRNGEIWSGGMNADMVVRTDTASGRSVGYLLPQSTNIRRVFVDNSTTPVTFWTGNNHHGSIIKLEPLD
jgi:streptogramin lyase